MIAGGDLMYVSDSWSGMNMYYGPAYLTTGIIYWVICFTMTKYVKRLEQKGAVG
jgi:putative glutamine transport system permease protein